LTDAGALRTWLAEHAEVDLAHRYEFWGRLHAGRRRIPSALLHIDDHTVHSSWLLDGEDTTVEIGLEEERVRSGFPRKPRPPGNRGVGRVPWRTGTRRATPG
jgi:hypothetical protein